MRTPRYVSNILVALVCSAMVSTDARTGTVIAQALRDGGTWRNLTNGNSVDEVQIDPRNGQVWTAGSGGAVRWDPTTETYAKFTTVDGLATNVVTAFAIEPDGTKWFGSEGGGISRLTADGAWTAFPPSAWGSSLGSDLISDIDFDSQGNRWFANYFGSVIRLSKDGEWREIDLDPNGFDVSDVDGVAVDRADNVWFASKVGAVRLAQDGTLTRFDRRDGLFDHDAWSVGMDLQGAIWVGTSQGVSRREPNGRWTNFRAQGGVWAMAFGQNGEAWFGTEAGLALLKPDGTFFYYFFLKVYDIAIDADGTKWVTAGDGLLKLTGRPQELDSKWFKTPDQPLDLDAISIAIDSHGNKWMGGLNGGVMRLDRDGVAEAFRDTPEVADAREIAAIAEDTLGNLWFGTDNKGVIRRSPDGTWTNITEADGLPDESVGDIAADRDGSVWFVAGEGITRRFADGSWRTYTQADGLLNDNIWSVAVDRLGNRWFGGRDGVTRLSATGTWSTLTQLWASAGKYVAIEDIFFDQRDNTWFVSYDSSLEMPTPHYTLTRYATDGSWQSMDLSDVFDGLYGFRGAGDPAGNVWLVADWRGGGPVLRLDSNGQRTRFGATDGVGSIQPSALAVDPNSGEVWTALSDGGVSVYTPTAAGSSCAAATALKSGMDVTAQLDTAAATHVYSISVPTRFTRVEVAIPDTENALWVDIFRECDTTAGPTSGRHIGPVSGRHIGGEQRLVFDVASQTGVYYVSVEPRPGQRSYPLRYRLRVGLTTFDPAAKHTLILTHEPRLQALFGLNVDHPELTAWRQSLQDLAESTSVGGLLVRNLQSDTNSAVQAAYTRWILRPTEVDRANAVAEALRDWIWDVRRDFPRLKYIVLAGDDRVIPHVRLPIVKDVAGDTDWQTETAYALEGSVDAGSSIGSALLQDFTLSDDVYGARQPVGWGAGQEIHLPELAVGRLVEHPRDMTAVIGAFLANGGELKLQRGLVAGYDFMQDAAQLVDRDLGRAGLDSAARTPALLGPAWTVGQLRQQLFESRHDLAFLAVHATHSKYFVPNKDVLQAEEVAAAAGDLSGMLTFGLACHGGLNVPGLDHRQPMDFPEAWLSRGGTYVGTTGWAYGVNFVLAYEEELMAEFTRMLLAGGGSAVGDALVAAKQAYFKGHDLNARHVKTLESTVLYGLPMYRVQPPRASALASPAVDSGAGQPHAAVFDAPSARDALTQVGSLAWKLDDRNYTFPVDDLQLVPETEGNYYTFSGLRPRAEGGEPVQPKVGFALGEIDLGGRVLDPRGVVLTRADFRDKPNFQPLIQRAQVFGARLASLDQGPAFNEPGWYPRVPVSLRRLDRTIGAGTLLVGQVQASLLFYIGQFNAETRTERLFERMVLDEYYSDSADRTGPAVQTVDTTPSGATMHLSVRATDESGLARVLAAFSVSNQPWESRELRRDERDGTWGGDVPNGSSYIVQLVDAAGNVTSVDDRGNVNRPCDRLCGGELHRAYLPSLQRTFTAPIGHSVVEDVR